MTEPVRAIILALVVILLLASVPVGSSTGISTPSGTAAEDTSAIVQTGLPDADTTVTRIALEENGTAHWSVTIRTRLSNESDVEDFEAFQERFRADRDAHVDRFEQRMTGVVSRVNESTDRPMNASAFRAETSIQEVPRRWGTVTFSFRWTGFAAVEDDAAVVGDVFEGGLYLGENDLLEIAPPADYTSTTATPPPDETDGATLVWTGPEDFDDREPAVRFEPTEAESATATETTDSTDSTGWVSPTLVGAASIGVLTLAGIALIVVSDRGPLSRLGSRIPVSIGSPTDDSGSGSRTPDESGRSTTTDSPDDADSKSTSESDPEPDPALDPDLLTDEDQVRRLLERNGGRMRQAGIADELEWSASKTSRVVSSMAEDETIEKLRIGRENVIDLLEDAD